MQSACLMQEDNSLKVIKREFTDPAKSRKAYAQHGLIRWVADLSLPCTNGIFHAKWSDCSCGSEHLVQSIMPACCMTCLHCIMYSNADARGCKFCSGPVPCFIAKVHLFCFLVMYCTLAAGVWPMGWLWAQARALPKTCS